MSDLWRNTGYINFVLEGDGFYISFNPAPRDSDNGNAETALCYGGIFKILNGDFREAYERLAPLGLEACQKFYAQQSAHAASSWTTPRNMKVLNNV